MRRGAILLILAGCTPGHRVRSITDVRDSAGIQIVENPPRAAAPIAFRLGDQPILDIGGLEANTDDELGPGTLHAVAELSDGRLAVLDGSRVRYYSPDGKLIRTVGQRGAGPGDLGQGNWLCRTRGDTVLFEDLINHRYSIFDASGAIVRTVPFPDGFANENQRQFCFGDGAMVKRLTDGRVVAIGTDGTVRREYAGIPLPPHLITYWVTVAAMNDRLYVGDNRHSKIRMLAADGKLLRIIRTDDTPAPITDEDRKKDGELSGMMDVTGKDKPVTVAGGPAVKVTEWPAYSTVLADPSGRLWIHAEPHAAVQGWAAFDSTGRLIGRFEPPPHPDAERWGFTQFGVDHVTFVHLDSVGAPHVTVYPLVRVP